VLGRLDAARQKAIANQHNFDREKKFSVMMVDYCLEVIVETNSLLPTINRNKKRQEQVPTEKELVVVSCSLVERSFIRD
jgi:hypothetical protein